MTGDKTVVKMLQFLKVVKAMDRFKSLVKGMLEFCTIVYEYSSSVLLFLICL